MLVIAILAFSPKDLSQGSNVTEPTRVQTTGAAEGMRRNLASGGNPDAAVLRSQLTILCTASQDRLEQTWSVRTLSPLMMQSSMSNIQPEELPRMYQTRGITEEYLEFSDNWIRPWVVRPDMCNKRTLDRQKSDSSSQVDPDKFAIDPSNTLIEWRAHGTSACIRDGNHSIRREMQGP